jgi:hypothetical protein
MTIVSTDARSRVVLPGHPNRMFLLRENSDGSLLLEPAVVASEAQAQYAADPELKALLDRALAAPTVRRRRRVTASEGA